PAPRPSWLFPSSATRQPIFEPLPSRAKKSPETKRCVSFLEPLLSLSGESASERFGRGGWPSRFPLSVNREQPAARARRKNVRSEQPASSDRWGRGRNWGASRSISRREGHRDRKSTRLNSSHQI